MDFGFGRFVNPKEAFLYIHTFYQAWNQPIYSKESKYFNYRKFKTEEYKHPAPATRNLIDDVVLKLDMSLNQTLEEREFQRSLSFQTI